MNISRRSFLRVGSMISVSAMIPGTLATLARAGQREDEKIELGTGIGFPIPKSALADPLAHITRLQWQQNIGSKFSFSLHGVHAAEMLSGLLIMRILHSFQTSPQVRESASLWCSAARRNRISGRPHLP